MRRTRMESGITSRTAPPATRDSWNCVTPDAIIGARQRSQGDTLLDSMLELSVRHVALTRERATARLHRSLCRCHARFLRHWKDRWLARPMLLFTTRPSVGAGRRCSSNSFGTRHGYNAHCVYGEYLQLKADVRRALKRAESAEERHITYCAVCQSEARTAFITSHGPD